jgi:acyl carrier protein
MERTEVAHVVKETIARESASAWSARDLDDVLKFGDDVKIDSITFIRVVISIEEQLDVETPDDALMQTQFHTVGDLVDFFVGLV